MQLDIQIDDKQIQKFMKASPDQADWAMREAMKMAGGHYRRWLADSLKTGRLPMEAVKFKKKIPLSGMWSLVHFRVSRIQKKFMRLQIGFFWAKAARTKSATHKKRKERFKTAYGLSPLTLARAHEYGRSQRITPKMRKKLAAMGHPVKKSTKRIKLPIREMTKALWKRKKSEIPNYVEKRFFQKFFDKRNPYNK